MLSAVELASLVAVLLVTGLLKDRFVRDARETAAQRRVFLALEMVCLMGALSAVAMFFPNNGFVSLVAVALATFPLERYHRSRFPQLKPSRHARH